MTESLGRRAALLVAAAVGFWVLGIGLVLCLAVGGIAILAYSPEYPAMGLIPLALGGALALGILPRNPRRADDDDAPLAPDEHPALHAFVSEVAAKAGARAPEALYVLHVSNAFAGTRPGGRLAARRATVGIGLPFLALFTQAELGAIVAHEMGHHIGGDVRLGPWVHKTRRAIAQAVD